MAISLESISKGKAQKAPRLVLGGVEGIGKSTAASKCPNPIFIPMRGEQGIDQIDTSKFPPANSINEVLEAIGILYNEDHNYQTVAIDSVSALEPLIWDQVAKDYGVATIEAVMGGYGKGYGEAVKYWRMVTDGLDALRDAKNIGCVLIGHVKTKEFNDPESDPYTTYLFDLQEKAASHLSKWADGVFFCNFRRAIVQKSDVGFNKTVSRATSTGERKLYTDKRPAHFGKNRYGLPYENDLDMPKILELIRGSSNVAAA